MDPDEETEPVSPVSVSLRMLVDDEPAAFEHGRLPSLVWRDSGGWQNDRPARFTRALRNVWRRV
ncbi:hypothetical protein [Paractinoplanes durhamensis]|uniref:Uncharacterized protein n=2 Tax=Paractinoplanes durhamensis TaxID=113563 RepID=A0ABQ3YTR6_9ACTN|nr:hypothetical protein [Actinoplanes durhamensis]GIE00734.1 hypothetical protein Adu01nite_20840 [Actinoplanes durhamensis]